MLAFLTFFVHMFFFFSVQRKLRCWKSALCISQHQHTVFHHTNKTNFQHTVISCQLWSFLGFYAASQHTTASIANIKTMQRITNIDVIMFSNAKIAIHIYFTFTQCTNQTSRLSRLRLFHSAILEIVCEKL